MVLNRVKIILSGIFKKYPNIKIFIKKVQFFIWKYELILYRRNAHIDEVVWINPQEIKKIGIGWGYSSRKYNIGAIKGGDWDLNYMEFEDLDVYQAFCDKFINGRNWEDTSYYSIIKTKILNGEKPWNMKSLSDFDTRLKEIELLYKEIKKNGYKSQRELGKSNQLKVLDEITVRIGRNGEILFENGRHRLSIAKILSLSKIPILITWRHKEWNTFKYLLKQHEKSYKGGHVYKIVEHVDLQKIKSARNDCRYEIIKRHIPVNCGSLLDIGANLGYFCHKFEEAGFRCYAVESNYNNYYFLLKYKNMANKKFTAINTEIWNFTEKNYFDVVLALSIFHWCLKNVDSYQKLEKYLTRLKTKMIILEPHQPDELQMRSSYRNFNNIEFLDFICNKTGLQNRELIGKSERGRSLYKIY